MTTEHISVPREWHLASLNDGLFIIDQKPRPAGTDIPVGMGRMNPSVVLNVTDLPQAKAQAIVDAHNAAILSRATPSADSDGCFTLPNGECASKGQCIHTPSTPSVVTDEAIKRAWLVFDGQRFSDRLSDESMQRMWRVLESFAASMPVARAPNGLIQRLKEISEWETTGVLCDGELRKDARELSDRFGQPHSVTIDIAKRDAWKQAADFLLAAAPQAARVPEGWKLVPVDLTKGMEAILTNSKCVYGSAQALYKDLLAAAPQPMTIPAAAPRSIVASPMCEVSKLQAQLVVDANG